MDRSHFCFLNTEGDLKINLCTKYLETFVFEEQSQLKPGLFVVYDTELNINCALFFAANIILKHES